MGIKENRIQNLAITIDKVIHVLELMGNDEPPLIQLTEQEIYESLWGYQNVNSLRNTMLRNFQGYLNLKYEKNGFAVTKINQILDIIKSKENEKDELLDLENQNGKPKKGIKDTESNKYRIKNNKYRQKLVEIATILISCAEIDKSKKYICYRQLSDILLLYSKAIIFFKHNDNYIIINISKSGDCIYISF